MKILVTGAAGFVGSHLAEKLAELGHQVIGLDCYSDYYERSLKLLNTRDLQKFGINILELDLSRDELKNAVAGVEIIYHLAAQPGISNQVPYEAYVKNNLHATYRLLEAATKLKSLKCLVNVATSSVYGAQATDSEEVPPKPTSYYGVTKLAAEQLVLAYQREKGLPACSLRLFSVYGPRERPEKLYPKLIKSILEDKDFPLFTGSLEHSRSFTYIDDIVAGFIKLLDCLDTCQGEIFNIGSDIEITTARGIEIVEEIMGKKAKLITVPRRIGDQQRTCANISKAGKMLNYAPKTAPEAGLKAEVEWYCQKIFNLNQG